MCVGVHLCTLFLVCQPLILTNLLTLCSTCTCSAVTAYRSTHMHARTHTYIHPYTHPHAQGMALLSSMPFPQASTSAQPPCLPCVTASAPAVCLYIASLLYLRLDNYHHVHTHPNTHTHKLCLHHIILIPLCLGLVPRVFKVGKVSDCQTRTAPATCSKTQLCTGAAAAVPSLLPCIIAGKHSSVAPSPQSTTPSEEGLSQKPVAPGVLPSHLTSSLTTYVCLCVGVPGGNSRGFGSGRFGAHIQSEEGLMLAMPSNKRAKPTLFNPNHTSNAAPEEDVSGRGGGFPRPPAPYPSTSSGSARTPFS